MSGIQQNRDSQAGMVSILVTLLLLIVISLIVMGFAQMSRRNQRQTLDRQLSSQAFYAAETAVNDIHNLINQQIAAGNVVPPKPDCTNGAGPAAALYGTLNPTIDAASKVSYSCVMVNPAPTSLAYGDIGTASTVVPLTSGSGANFTSVKLTWQSKTGSSTPTTGCPVNATNKFSPTSSWTCGYGVLRFDLVPVSSNSLNATTLQDTTYTSFLVPVPSSATTTTGYPGAAPASSNGNNLIATRCTNTECSMTITGLSTSKYYLRLMSYYQNVSLQVTATDTTGPATLFGSQAIVDATGKSQDILRRIQVRLPLSASNTNLLSDYALQTTDSICKRFAATDGYFQSSAAAAVPGLSNLTAPPNPLCQ
jgi:Tfp pilus assembly protein PilX